MGERGQTREEQGETNELPRSLHARSAACTRDRPHGFLFDLVPLEAALAEVLGHIRDSLLNDLLEFQGVNPSLERFARYLSNQLIGFLDQADPKLRIQHSIVRLWESPTAWAAWTEGRA